MNGLTILQGSNDQLIFWIKKMLLMILCSFALHAHAATKYVKPTGNDSNTGDSWAQAYQTLQKAIEASVAGDQIWLASGTYYPTRDNTGAIPSDVKLRTFFVNKSIAIYGGFNGTESSLTQRDWRTNIATLSGDVGTVGNDGDNAYHVVYIQGVSGSMILDGVAITKGNANGSINGASGLGGGILVYATGGITSEPAINNCRIYDNRATGGGGVGIVSIVSGSSLPTFTNCLFENNIASIRAGAVYSLSDGNNIGVPFSISVFEYCTFYNNDSPGSTKVGHSTAINDGGSTVTFDKCIIWGNPSGTYLDSDVDSDLRLENSLSKGGCTTDLICAGTILNVDPLFVNAAGGNLRLTAGSPAADVSGGEYYTGSPTGKDYDGNNRPVGCYDYGAFESTTSTAPVITCYQDMDNDGYGVAGITKQFCTACAEYWADNTLDCDDNSSAISPYTLSQNGTFSPVAGAGTSVTLADDQVSNALPIGFTFSFFGNSYTNFAISSNGFITFSPFSSGCCIGQNIPNTSAPNNLIALAWEDLDPSSGGGISYFTTGTAPNRKLIVNYSSVAVLGSSSTVTSQVILYETSNIIEIHSASIGGLDSGTMGIENSGGTVAVAVPGRNSTSWSTTNDYVAFTPSTAGPLSTTFYRDMDGDGFGNLAVTQQSCTQPSGYVTNSTDCNDNNAAIKPGATEICDGLDNDCDGFIDEGAALVTWYRDMDGDGFGNLAVTQQSCTQPSGYVANSTDCNDNNAAIKPGATEVCDGIDNDCDGSTDEGVLTTWYRDLDGDTYGNPASTQQACSQPTGYVANSTDCDDNDALEKPGQVWYKDTDNDGYAQTGAAPITQCLRPTGYKVVTELLATSGDCNDNNAAIKPGATEVCDGVDNDCDNSIDEGVLTTFYRDLDGDGFGDNLNTITACNEPVGYTSNNTDCNDNDALEFPGQVWFKDTDNDGYAQTGAASITACARPTGYRVFMELIALTGDCNDNNAAINPGISEVCEDLVDNDCDGAIDEGCILNYLINTTGTTIVITDVLGQSDPLAVSESSGNIRFIVTPTNRTYSLNGGPVTEFTTPADVALTGIQTITINTATGNDVINIGAFTTAFPSLTVNGGTGNDIVNFNGDISFIANAHLDVDMQNDEAAPGEDQVNVATNTNLVLAGTGAATVKVSRSVLVSSGGSITTENGDLTVEANQQVSSTAGSFVGVTLSGGLLQASGTGTVAVRGKGGNSGADQRGVYLQSTGKIQSGSGTVTVVGTGGASTESGNEGVSIISTNSRITSSGGNISVTGQGGGSGTSVDNYGIAISTGGEITAGGSGTVSVQGTGGASTGNDNYGVSVRGTNARITSSSGHVSVTGQGGGSGTSSNGYGVTVSSGGEITAGGSGAVTVQGTGSTSTGSTNTGVIVRNANSRITSSGGNVSVTGQGGNGAGGTNYGVGVLLSAEITAGSTGTVTVQGTAGTSASGSDYGIFINSAGSRITSSGGNVSVTGQGGGSGSSNNNHGIFIFSAGEITAGGSGTVTVQGTGGTSTGSTNYGISINGASSRITSSGGHVSTTGQGGNSSADIITQSGGVISSTSTTAGITLHSTNNGMRPNTNSTDVSTTATQKTIFGTGSKLTIFVSGLTAHTQYQQLGVVGMIDLNGADLVMLNTVFTPASGNTFTIVDNDGTDAIIGTFNGLPEGATIPNFLGSGLNATITYMGGTNNDVVITVATSALCYADTDEDGYGDPNSSMTFGGACGTGYVSNNTDCDDDDPLEFPGQVWYKDADGDDYSDGTSLMQCLRPANHYAASELIATTGDCNDANAAINPGATEICDGVDNNCIGGIDEGVQTTYYRDLDGDGFGNASNTTMACSVPSGYVANNTDCDDNDALEFPGQVWYKDVDGDDYSDGTSLMQCLRPANHYAASELIATSGDCNDGAAAINPGATEVCDGVDNDCDGSIDDGVLTTYYRDLDGDGFGNSAMTQQACSQPTGYVTNNTDCDDNDNLEFPGQVWYKDADGDDYSDGTSLMQCLRPANHYAASELIATTGDCNDGAAAINPAATEICDGIDNDCDSNTDEGLLTTYYRDFDGDGFGNAAMTQQACSVPTGYVANNTDCDDNDNLEFPGQVWYKDVDGDDYSEGSSLTQCLRPANHYAASELIAISGDCNDGAAAINPGATEICDGVDNDCDGSTDEGGLTTYYQDLDGDGFGNAAMSQQACSVPTGYVANNTDCDDNDNLEFPGQVWYQDADGDDYSDGTSLTQCLRPTNHYAASELIATSGDCNDGAAAINPAATEVCDGIDNDCDGSIDDGVLTTYYRDMDGDGFGNASNTTMACSVPTGYVTNSTDCDDNDALEFPGQVWYKDVDGDDYSDGTSLTQCLRPTNHYAASELIATTGDCNDNNAAIRPNATEVCDGVDNDCDGSIDEGVLTTYYRDMDGDGFGNASNTTTACSVPTGYVTNSTDCDDNDALEFPGQVWYKDVDGDDYSDGTSLTQCLRPTNHYAASELIATTGDCNDNNAAINPAATEVCDGVDNNCDGMLDNGTLTTYYQDSDGDGFGNAAMTQQACSQPTGYVTNSTDCDDNDALEFPGQVWYKDVDGDDYSDGTSLTQCLRPSNHYAASELIATTGDCNDNNAAIRPNAIEVCDGIDNDCDGSIDDGVLTTYYRDLDGDGFGNASNTTMACSVPTGYVTNSTDCDDNDALEFPGQVWYKDVDGDDYSDGSSLTQCLRPTNHYAASELIATTGDCNDNNAAIRPNATEVCDGIDNDCDGSIDDGVLTTYYRDLDGDGFGNASNTTMACSVPTGYVTNSTDCDDNDALEFPGQVWYKDVDGDDYSDGSSLTQCLRPTNHYAASELIATTGDCNDGAAAINPAAAEVCDGIDNDCDGSIDDGVLTTYYRDLDGDGFGNASNTTMACSVPTGYVTNSTDCDDNDALEFPGQVWYKDVDGDDYSDGTSLTQCLRPTNHYAASELIATTGDCNDNNAAINPAATEVCDGIDNDCDGSIDDGVLTTYYRDLDGDGFGNASNTTMACSVPTGYVTNSTDCDDNDALEFPGQVWYKDVDGDDYSDGTSLTQCLRPTNHYAASELIATTGDCNDNSAAINPAATEVCDGVDNDCDGSIDEGVLTTYYRDLDGDGFGNPSNSTTACSVPSGYVTNNTDCDDNDALEKPGQVWYKDVDGDDYSDGSSLTQCLRPANHYAASELIATTGDCNDNNAAIRPNATEVCDGVDNDCDGSIDEGVLTTYYRDLDGDGFGNPSNTTMACSVPTGYVTNNTDCDDNDALEKPGQVWYKDVDGDDYSDGTSLTQCLRPANHYAASELIATTGDCNDNSAAIRPGATEVCDGVDNDCDGSIDEGVLTTYYRDMDGDGFGNPSNTTMACSLPTSYVINNTDCDDGDALEKPGQVWYKDADGDGYSDGSSLTQCLRPANYYVASELTATNGDCNDGDTNVNPDAEEVCDSVDNDCNGQVDDLPGGLGNWQVSTTGTATGSANFPACFAEPQDIFTLNSTGVSSPASDNLLLVYQQLCGNSQITARVLSVGGGGWAGVMMRESLSAGSKKVALKTQLSTLIRREIRSAANGPTSNLQFVRPQHIWLRLTRNGNTLAGYTSADGQSWSFAFTATISMEACIYVGVFSESINGSTTTAATFDNVSVTSSTAPSLQQQHTGFEESAQNWDIEVYPNPSNGLVNLRLLHPSDEPVAVRVLNTLGEQLMYFPELPAGELQRSLDLTGLPAGVYHLLLETDGQLPLSKRVVLTQD